jgi:hypothetical protein
VYSKSSIEHCEVKFQLTHVNACRNIWFSGDRPTSPVPVTLLTLSSNTTTNTYKQPTPPQPRVPSPEPINSTWNLKRTQCFRYTSLHLESLLRRNTSAPRNLKSLRRQTATMPRAEVGSNKYIANKMKSKGLQRLRWFCQACEKQCRFVISHTFV